MTFRCALDAFVALPLDPVLAAVGSDGIPMAEPSFGSEPIVPDPIPELIMSDPGAGVPEPVPMLPVLGVVMVPLGLVDCAVATVARPSEDEAIRIIFEIFIKVLPKVIPNL